LQSKNKKTAILMNNTKYYKLIEKIKAEIAKNGVTTAIVEDLKAMRVMVVTENQPLLAKVIRLTFQHIEEHGTFNVAIPEDEPIEGFEEEMVSSEINPVESLDYLLSNMNDISKKSNEADIRDFVADLKEQAGEDY
jgi:hypothetical protein